MILLLDTFEDNVETAVENLHAMISGSDLEFDEELERRK